LPLRIAFKKKRSVFAAFDSTTPKRKKVVEPKVVKPVLPPPSPPGEDSGLWQCAVCTMENPISEARCDGCNARQRSKKRKKTTSSTSSSTEPKKRKKNREPKFEWVEVVRNKKRIKRTDLNIIATGRPGLDAERIQKRMDEETAMQVEMREIIETDVKRNDLEAYIFDMRDKIATGGQLAEFISNEDREKYTAELTKAEDWLYDAVDATKIQFIEKLGDLTVQGDMAKWRFKENSIRDEWVLAVKGTISNYRRAAQNPGDIYSHIAPEKLQKIIKATAELEDWLKSSSRKH